MLSDGIRNSFERNGHHMHVVHDAIAALDMVESNPGIGIVVAQLARPHFDGLALVERMHANVKRPLQFIIVATAATSQDVVQAIHLQVADFVTDPEDGGQLHGALARALSAQQGATARGMADREPMDLRRSEALEDAYWHGLALINAVKALRDGRLATAPPPVPKAEPPGRNTPENRRLEVLRALQQSRIARDKFFPKGLFEDPCWDMLLDLMMNHLRGRRISVSSLCVASGAAQTTALRRISELNECGLVRRVADERDGRRVFVELTEQGIAALSSYIEHIQAQS